MKNSILLVTLALVTQSAFAKKESIAKDAGKKFGPPIQIMADGTATVFASNVLTDDCNQGSSLAEALPENGSVSSFDSTPPKLECDNSYPHLKGDINIHGAAALELFNGMRDVKLHPGVPDILERDRNSLNWDEIPYKTGRNIFCFQYPVKKLDKAVLETSCRIDVTNLNTGEIATNEQ